jgi:hypothetical protein
MKICLCSLLLTVWQNSDFNSSCKKVLGNLEEKNVLQLATTTISIGKINMDLSASKVSAKKKPSLTPFHKPFPHFFSPNDVPAEGNFGPMQTYKQHATLQWDLCSDRGIYRSLGCKTTLTRICQESLHKGPPRDQYSHIKKFVLRFPLHFGTQMLPTIFPTLKALTEIS